MHSYVKSAVDFAYPYYDILNDLEFCASTRNLAIPNFNAYLCFIGGYDILDYGVGLGEIFFDADLDL